MLEIGDRIKIVKIEPCEGWDFEEAIGWEGFIKKADEFEYTIEVDEIPDSTLIVSHDSICKI